MDFQLNYPLRSHNIHYFQTNHYHLHYHSIYFLITLQFDKKYLKTKTTHKRVTDVIIKPAKDGNTYKSYVEGKDRFMLCQNSVEGGNYFKGRLCSEWSKVANDTVKSLCWKCTAQLVPFEEKFVKKSDKPRGWAFMKEYVHKDGTVYQTHTAGLNDHLHTWNHLII